MATRYGMREVPECATDVALLPDLAPRLPAAGKRLHCPFCSSTVDGGQMLNHIRFHLDYRPVVCGYCGAAFVSIEFLEVHAHEKGHIPLQCRHREDERLERLSNLCLFYCEEVAARKEPTDLKSLESVLLKNLEAIAPETMTGFHSLIIQDAAWQSPNRNGACTALKPSSSIPEPTPSAAGRPGQPVSFGRNFLPNLASVDPTQQLRASECAICRVFVEAQEKVEHACLHLQQDGLPPLYVCKEGRDCGGYASARKASMLQHAFQTGHGFNCNSKVLGRYFPVKWEEAFPSEPAPNLQRLTALNAGSKPPATPVNSSPSPARPLSSSIYHPALSPVPRQHSTTNPGTLGKEHQPGLTVDGQQFAENENQNQAIQRRSLNHFPSPKTSSTKNEGVILPAADFSKFFGDPSESPSVSPGIPSPASLPITPTSQNLATKSSSTVKVDCRVCWDEVSEGDKDLHVWTHHMSRMIECLLCGAKMASSEAVLNHVNKAHKGEMQIRDNRNATDPDFARKFVECFPEYKKEEERNCLRETKTSSPCRSDSGTLFNEDSPLPVKRQKMCDTNIDGESPTSVGGPDAHENESIAYPAATAAPAPSEMETTRSEAPSESSEGMVPAKKLSRGANDSYASPAGSRRSTGPKKGSLRAIWKVSRKRKVRGGPPRKWHGERSTCRKCRQLVSNSRALQHCMEHVHQNGNPIYECTLCPRQKFLLRHNADEHCRQVGHSDADLVIKSNYVFARTLASKVMKECFKKCSTRPRGYVRPFKTTRSAPITTASRRSGKERSKRIKTEKATLSLAAAQQRPVDDKDHSLSHPSFFRSEDRDSRLGSLKCKICNEKVPVSGGNLRPLFDHARKHIGAVSGLRCRLCSSRLQVFRTIPLESMRDHYKDHGAEDSQFIPKKFMSSDSYIHLRHLVYYCFSDGLTAEHPLSMNFMKCRHCHFFIQTSWQEHHLEWHYKICGGTADRNTLRKRCYADSESLSPPDDSNSSATSVTPVPTKSNQSSGGKAAAKEKETPSRSNRSAQTSRITSSAKAVIDNCSQEQDVSLSCSLCESAISVGVSSARRRALKASLREHAKQHVKAVRIFICPECTTEVPFHNRFLCSNRKSMDDHLRLDHGTSSVALKPIEASASVQSHLERVVYSCFVKCSAKPRSLRGRSLLVPCHFCQVFISPHSIVPHASMHARMSEPLKSCYDCVHFNCKEHGKEGSECIDRFLLRCFHRGILSEFNHLPGVRSEPETKGNGGKGAFEDKGESHALDDSGSADTNMDAEVSSETQDLEKPEITCDDPDDSLAESGERVSSAKCRICSEDVHFDRPQHAKAAFLEHAKLHAAQVKLFPCPKCKGALKHRVICLSLDTLWVHLNDHGTECAFTSVRPIDVDESNKSHVERIAYNCFADSISKNRDLSGRRTLLPCRYCHFILSTRSITLHARRHARLFEPFKSCSQCVQGSCLKHASEATERLEQFYARCFDREALSELNFSFCQETESGADRGRNESNNDTDVIPNAEDSNEGLELEPSVPQAVQSRGETSTANDDYEEKIGMEDISRFLQCSLCSVKVDTWLNDLHRVSKVALIEHAKVHAADVKIFVCRACRSVPLKTRFMCIEPETLKDHMKTAHGSPDVNFQPLNASVHNVKHMERVAFRCFATSAAKARGAKGRPLLVSCNYCQLLIAPQYIHRHATCHARWVEPFKSCSQCIRSTCSAHRKAASEIVGSIYERCFDRELLAQYDLAVEAENEIEAGGEDRGSAVDFEESGADLSVEELESEADGQFSGSCCSDADEMDFQLIPAEEETSENDAQVAAEDDADVVTCKAKNCGLLIQSSLKDAHARVHISWQNADFFRYSCILCGAGIVAKEGILEHYRTEHVCEEFAEVAILDNEDIRKKFEEMKELCF